MENVKALYRAWKGEDPVSCDRLTAAGSNREYYRLTSPTGETVVGVKGTSREENEAFIYLSGHFAEKGLPVPEVLAVSEDKMRYLQTDLGSVALFDAVREGREKGGDYSAEEIALLEKVIYKLPDFQFRGAEDLDATHCYPQQSFDKTGILFDLNYFKYCFLKPTGVDFHEVKLENAFQEFADFLASKTTCGFMYRDFQARNVMLCSGEPYFIDFQGGRKGPIYYDIASFLWQASAKYSVDLYNRLLDVYFKSLERYIEVDRPLFRVNLMAFGLFRTLQVLGAYGYRGNFERKPHFLKSIPVAMKNLYTLVHDPATYLFVPTYLISVLHNMVDAYRIEHAEECSDWHVQCVSNYKSQQPKTADAVPSLVVDVYSFSYKKGIPEDTSGNGGGYVFDCRSTNNPGRYAEYKHVTGLDAPVIRFLEKDGEILTFLESVYKLVDFHANRFIQRGFTHLQVSFGCTGGQHRSVYSAQHVAEHLHEKFGIEVRIHHREQGIESVLK